MDVEDKRNVQKSEGSAESLNVGEFIRYKQSKDVNMSMKHLGAGTFGNIFIVERTDEHDFSVGGNASKRLKALKVVPSSSAYMSELMLAGLCVHPGLIGIQGPVVYDEQFKVISFEMELCANVSDVSKEGLHTPYKMLGYIYQMASALAFLHRQSLVHCDIKDNNVVFRHTPRVGFYDAVICDFGKMRLGKIFTRRDDDNLERCVWPLGSNIFGALGYKDPSSYTSDMEDLIRVSQETDIYSLAVTIPVINKCLMRDGCSEQLTDVLHFPANKDDYYERVARCQTHYITSRSLDRVMNIHQQNILKAAMHPQKEFRPTAVDICREFGATNAYETDGEMISYKPGLVDLLDENKMYLKQEDIMQITDNAVSIIWSCLRRFRCFSKSVNDRTTHVLKYDTQCVIFDLAVHMLFEHFLLGERFDANKLSERHVRGIVLFWYSFVMNDSVISGYGFTPDDQACVELITQLLFGSGMIITDRNHFMSNEWLFIDCSCKTYVPSMLTRSVIQLVDLIQAVVGDCDHEVMPVTRKIIERERERQKERR